MFNIAEVSVCDCHLLVKVEHLNDDGSPWFWEQYIWQGREGIKQNRASNPDGEFLMDNGEVAPFLEDVRHPEQYLPDGRTWARRPGTHMDNSSILGAIREVHQQRQGGFVGYNGWITPSLEHRTDDEDGCAILLDRFSGLVGRYDS